MRMMRRLMADSRMMLVVLMADGIDAGARGLFALWRRSRSFQGSIVPANALLMVAGFLLFGYQLAGYLLAP